MAEVERPLVTGVKEGLHERFAALKRAKRPGDDVAGRAWVAAYVPFVALGGGGVHAAAEGAGAHGGEAAGSDATPAASAQGHGHKKAPNPRGVPKSLIAQ